MSGLLSAVSMLLMATGLCCLAIWIGLPENLRQTVTLATLPQHCKRAVLQNIQSVLGENTHEGHELQLQALRRENLGLRVQIQGLHRAHWLSYDESGLTGRAMQNFAEFHGIPVSQVDRIAMEQSSLGLVGWARQSHGGDSAPDAPTSHENGQGFGGAASAAAAGSAPAAASGGGFGFGGTKPAASGAASGFGGGFGGTKAAASTGGRFEAKAC